MYAVWLRTALWMAVVVVASGGTVWAQVPVARYDPQTGGITFDHVSAVLGLRINSASNLLVAGEATDLNGAAGGPLGVVNDQAPNFLEWGNLSGMTFEEAFAGNVLQENLSHTEIFEGTEFLYRTIISPSEDIVSEIWVPIDQHETIIASPVEGSQISLRPALRHPEGQFPAAISLINGGLGSLQILEVSISNDQHGLFDAAVVGLDIDLSLDLTAVGRLAAGSSVESGLRIETNRGNLNYTLLLAVPEPMSAGLLGLAIVSLAFTRRRATASPCH